MSSSNVPYDVSRERKVATIAQTAGVWIDWGPDLPARYPGGRARVLVANPTTIFVSWETERVAPDRWAIEIELIEGRVTSHDLPGKSPDVWVQVPPGSRGVVRLVRIERGGREEVVMLPFETPPDGPSWRTDERWGRLGRKGGLDADVPPPDGARMPLEAPVVIETVGYEGALNNPSSGELGRVRG